jgi:peroxiredoxin
VLQVKRRAEAASRGETPAAGPAQDQSHAARIATLDQPAPDFIVTNLLTKETTQLRRWLGRPVLMVFYHPDSATVESVLRFAQGMQNRYHQHLAVLGFAVSDDGERIKRQALDLGLGLPICSGKGLRQTYGVEATPKLIILDAGGVVRGSYLGWGPETAGSIAEELQRWVSK